MGPQANAELVERLVAQGDLRSPNLIAAFKQVDRAHFVPGELKTHAYGNYPLPIGWGQTISQPSTVAIMLELLQPAAGQRVLEVGAGSGYVAALLAAAVGQAGRVLALERMPELAALAQQNLQPYGFAQLTVRAADGSQGVPGEGRFDRVIVSAAAHSLPQALVKSLTSRGKLVIPVGQDTQALVVIERTAHGLREQRVSGFVFVPLIVGKP